MKICIIYYSKYGNGRKLAEHLGTIMREKEHEVELFPCNELKSSSIPFADLYFFSSPTHMGGPAGKMKKFLKHLEIGQENAKYALITTTLDAKGKTLRKMEYLLQTKGLTKISEGLAVLVTGMKGPLEEGYKEKLEAFATDVLGESSGN